MRFRSQQWGKWENHSNGKKSIRKMTRIEELLIVTMTLLLVCTWYDNVRMSCLGSAVAHLCLITSQTVSRGLAENRRKTKKRQNREEPAPFVVVCAVFMCAVQVLYFEWRHVRRKHDLTLPFTTVGVDINNYVDNNNSTPISSTLYYGARCRM